MTITNAEFRANFPEFGDANKYTETDLTFWFTLAYLLLNAQRWGDLLDFGAQLYVAHNCALEQMAKEQARKGGIPGAASGMLNSKSVDKVSAGYDTASVAEEFAGSWNLTTFGMRLWKLLQQFGAGPVQVGAGAGCAPIQSAYPGYWFGPW